MVISIAARLLRYSQRPSVRELTPEVWKQPPKRAA